MKGFNVALYPVLDGRRADWPVWNVTLRSDGRIENLSGSWVTFERAGDYKLRGVSAALKELQSPPVPPPPMRGRRGHRPRRRPRRRRLPVYSRRPVPDAAEAPDRAERLSAEPPARGRWTVTTRRGDTGHRAAPPVCPPMPMPMPMPAEKATSSYAP